MMIKKKLLFLLLTLTGGLYGVTKSNLSDDFSQLPPQNSILTVER